VLATRHLAPWRLVFWVKFIGTVVQLRPRALKRHIAHRDRRRRHGIRWYYRMGRRVCPSRHPELPVSRPASGPCAGATDFRVMSHSDSNFAVDFARGACM